MNMKRYADGLRTCRDSYINVTYYPGTWREETDFPLHVLHRLRDEVLLFVKHEKPMDIDLYSSVFTESLFASKWGRDGYDKRLESYALSSMLMVCSNNLTGKAMVILRKKLADMIDDIANGDVTNDRLP